MMNFCQYSITNGGIVKMLPYHYQNDVMIDNIANPSLIKLGNTYIVNCRRLNYATLNFHYMLSEINQKEHTNYPLIKTTFPYHDNVNITTNVLLLLDENLNYINQYEMQDDENLFNFIDYGHHNISFKGLEDIRLMLWEDSIVSVASLPVENNKYLNVKQICSSYNINSHKIIDSHIMDGYGNTSCEKNWMPIDNMPFHFIKYSNDTCITSLQKDFTIKNFDPIKNKRFQNFAGLRGSSQVCTYNNRRYAIVHEVDINSPYTAYLHRIITWDNNFNIINITPPFKFTDIFCVEFNCGMCFSQDSVIIPFSINDSVSYIMQIPIEKFITFSQLTIPFSEYYYIGKKISYSDIPMKFYTYHHIQDYYYMAKKEETRGNLCGALTFMSAASVHAYHDKYFDYGDNLKEQCYDYMYKAIDIVDDKATINKCRNEIETIVTLYKKSFK